MENAEVEIPHPPVPVPRLAPPGAAASRERQRATDTAGLAQGALQDP